MCPSMETPETDQTWWWLSQCDRPWFCSKRCICTGMSSVSPSRSQPSPELGSSSSGQTVGFSSTALHPIANALLRWLYSYFLAVDGNFRLKLKRRGINDPEIGSGWSYFVENEKYVKHISENPTRTEVCTFGSSALTTVLTGSSGCWL